MATIEVTIVWATHTTETRLLPGHLVDHRGSAIKLSNASSKSRMQAKVILFLVYLVIVVGIVALFAFVPFFQKEKRRALSSR